MDDRFTRATASLGRKRRKEGSLNMGQFTLEIVIIGGHESLIEI